MSRARRTDPLDAQQRAAVRSAGGIGLALVGAGASIVGALLVVVLVVLIVRAVVIDLFDDVDWGRGVVDWVEGLEAWWAVPIVLVLLALAAGAIWLGCRLSTQRMQRAGVVGASAITRRGAALGTGLQAVLSALSSWILGLLVLLTGAIGFWIVAAIWVVLSIAVSTLIGWLAGPRTWLAIARRESRRAVSPNVRLSGPPSA